jgi:hypothetical protein
MPVENYAPTLVGAFLFLERKPKSLDHFGAFLFLGCSKVRSYLQ